MARTVVILIVLFIGIFSATEAALGDNCTEASNCTEPSENCTAGSCGCSNGYFIVSGNCKPNSITVSLSTQSKNAVYGSEVVLTATVTSEVPLKPIKWLRGSTELNTNESKYTQTGVGPGQVNLTVHNVNFDDTGDYQVEVSNAAEISNTSNQVPINVTGEKPIVTVPGTISETSTTVTINCNASVKLGSPALESIHWFFNGTSLGSQVNNKYSGGNLTTPPLTINNIGSTDVGKYECEASNRIGYTRSSNSVTLARPSGVTVTQQPASPVNYNSSVTLTGSYTSNHLNVTFIKWKKLNGSDFIDINIHADKYAGSSDTGTSPVLKINLVKLIDETSYRLVVSNLVGSSQSDYFSLNVIGGNLTLTTGANITGRYGGSVTIDCTVTGPEVNKIQWIKHINNSQENISIDGVRYSGGSVDTMALTINSLTNNDAGQYQCTASNPRGVFRSANRATVLVNYTDFAPVITGINSTTSTFTVFWNHPTSAYYNLVTGYTVKWRVTGASQELTSQSLDRAKKQHTVSNNLVSGQLYTVYVISHVTFTNTEGSILVNSNDTKIRLDPMPPGPINKTESIFAYDNLHLTWDAPANTIITKYNITLDGFHYSASGNVLTQFNKNFVPGKHYIVCIVTISGTTDEKESIEHKEWIRIIPTKPHPPTNVSCPQSPLDISLEISWIAPTEPNGLILKYLINVSPGYPGSQITTSSNVTMKNVESLTPEKWYNFTVQTVNDAVNSTSDPSKSVACKTLAGVSSAPTDFKIDKIQSRGFQIDFNKPDDVKGILAAYKIIISKGGNCVQQILVFGNCSLCKSTNGCPPPINYTVPNITDGVSYTASSLNPYTHYMVKVVAINGKGEGHPENIPVRTDEEVPQQPGQINATNIQSSQLTLSWTLPDPSPGNTTYTIYTYESTDDRGTNYSMKEPIIVYGFDLKTLSVTGLEEYWPYNFKVEASTVKGNNISDFSSVFRTKQAAPGKVLNLNVVQKGNDYRTAHVSWLPPALRDHNGVLQSYLFYSNHTGEKDIPVLPSETVVEENIPVVPETVYVVEVVLQNNESMKSQVSTKIYHAPAGAPPVSNIEPITTKPGQHDNTKTTITIEINTTYFKNNDNGKQVFFGVAVCAKSKCDDMTQNKLPNKQNWIDLPNWHKAKKNGFTMYRASNNTFVDKIMQEGTRQKRSTISASTIKFTIGEDQACPLLGEDMYCNGPLTPGTSYIVIIFACTNGGCSYNQTAEPYVTKTPDEDTDSNLTMIIGVVIAVVAVSVVVVVAFVVVRRRNRLGETKQYTKGIDNPTNFDEPVTKNIPRKRPIKLKELSDKVAEKHKDSNLHFAREYEDLKALSPKHPAETSEYDENKLKNRYVNILPFDHSRVKLMLTEDDDPSTDFINANYLPGYKSQREYIATQGPIPGTIDDFWRMIWEQNVSIIVMLTLCKEEGRVKCEMYWPENIHEPKQYGDLVVETVSCSTVNFYDFRIFKIKLGDTTRSVKHFHFLQWKDFSANVQNDVMIDFIKNVRNHIRPPDMNGPVVVHCSAGVGRTGTYCALDHLFQFVDEHDLDESIDIFDLVLNLRERRMFMVQTEQQYVFIHDCVRDYVERKRKELQGNLLYENINRGFVADEPEEDSLYQNYSNQRTDL